MDPARRVPADDDRLMRQQEWRGVVFAEAWREIGCGRQTHTGERAKGEKVVVVVENEVAFDISGI